jgi:hypothetical protein
MPSSKIYKFFISYLPCFIFQTKTKKETFYKIKKLRKKLNIFGLFLNLNQTKILNFNQKKIK